MAEAGVPERVADRAYKFTQIAWGRIFLDSLGVQFAKDYVCFNAAGDVIEAGQLADQPYFIAAMAAASGHPRPAGLARFAAMSADVSSINSALRNGSKPHDLVTAPPVLFMEPPTAAGMDKARRLLSQRLSAATAWSRTGTQSSSTATPLYSRGGGLPGVLLQDLLFASRVRGSLELLSQDLAVFHGQRSHRRQVPALNGHRGTAFRTDVRCNTTRFPRGLPACPFHGLNSVGDNSTRSRSSVPHQVIEPLAQLGHFS
jgi:hypothetical protein